LVGTGTSTTPSAEVRWAGTASAAGSVVASVSASGSADGSGVLDGLVPVASGTVGAASGRVEPSGAAATSEGPTPTSGVRPSGRPDGSAWLVPGWLVVPCCAGVPGWFGVPWLVPLAGAVLVVGALADGVVAGPSEMEPAEFAVVGLTVGVGRPVVGCVFVPVLVAGAAWVPVPVWLFVAVPGAFVVGAFVVDAFAAGAFVVAVGCAVVAAVGPTTAGFVAVPPLLGAAGTVPGGPPATEVPAVVPGTTAGAWSPASGSAAESDVVSLVPEWSVVCDGGTSTVDSEDGPTELPTLVVDDPS
jgi:hypothetical protein